MKCRYSHCLHSDREVSVEEAVLTGKSTYYHKDCYLYQQTIKEVRDFFIKNINTNAVYAQLNHVINDIVFNKGNEPELILFGMKYYMSHNMNLKYPQGLYYVVQNVEIQKKYEEYKRRQNRETVIIEPENNTFTYKPHKSKSVADLVV